MVGCPLFHLETRLVHLLNKYPARLKRHPPQPQVSTQLSPIRLMVVRLGLVEELRQERLLIRIQCPAQQGALLTGLALRAVPRSLLKPLLLKLPPLKLLPLNRLRLGRVFEHSGRLELC